MKALIVTVVALIVSGCSISNHDGYITSSYWNRLSQQTKYSNTDLQPIRVRVVKVLNANPIIRDSLLTTFNVKFISLDTKQKYAINFYNGELSDTFIKGQFYIILKKGNLLYDIKELMHDNIKQKKTYTFPNLVR